MSQTFECSTCRESRPWTNGRTRTAGDEVDEYWCTVCGAETELDGTTARELEASR